MRSLGWNGGSARSLMIQGVSLKAQNENPGILVSNSHFETFVLKSEPLKACALNFMNGRMGIPAIDSCSK